MTRIPALLFALTLALASTAEAMFMQPVPIPVEEAPIDRALANVEADHAMDPAQREDILGRLNLLAYARDDANFAYITESGELHESGAVPCGSIGPSMGGRPRPDAPATLPPPDAPCAHPDFHLGPRAELPADAPPEQPSPEARARLVAAERHYAAALALDHDNLRARLGHAYALDRLGRTRDARCELRTLIRLGLPKLQAPHSDWEDHAVLSEAATHLAHLAKSSSDRRRVAQLQERLGASQPMIYVTPVVVPLRDAPFDALTAPNSSVAFDFAGTGDRRAQGWLGTDAAWLVWDPDGRADIRSGFNMIGARAWAVFWRDGFAALRSLDDDHDGALAGAELSGLALWRDANGDGRSTPSEVRPVADYGIVSLAVRGRETRRDLLTAPGGVRLQDGSSRPLYDWTPGLARPNNAPIS